MSDATASFRYGSLNDNYRRMGHNLISFPRLHFLSVSEAPLFLKSVGNKNVGIDELTKQIWSSSNCYADLDFNDGKFLSSTCLYRGANVSTESISDQYGNAKLMVDHECYDDTNSVPWIPDQVKYSMLPVASSHSTMSAIHSCNTTAMKRVFQRISSQFVKMYRYVVPPLFNHHRANTW